MKAPQAAVRKYESGIRNVEAWLDQAVSSWNEWYSFIYDDLANEIARLPEKSGNLEVDIRNRVVPIARFMRRKADQYKARAVRPPVRVPARVPLA